MKYHNDGLLRVEPDMTIRFSLNMQKRRLIWKEYLPLITLCVLISGMLLHLLLA